MPTDSIVVPFVSCLIVSQMNPNYEMGLTKKELQWRQKVFTANDEFMFGL